FYTRSEVPAVRGAGGDMNTQQQNVQGKRFPLSNLEYDLITEIHSRLKGLEALETYQQDIQGHPQIQQIFQDMKQQDQQVVDRLARHLKQQLDRLGAGQQAGAAGH
ncbi:MAG: hypothetical protein ACRDFS_12705, partial [Chloroflexota bacterium]